jgi:lysophospholipase L1-like esterase
MNNLCCIGDSLTFFGGAPVTKNLTNRLSEKYPNLYVVNFGVSGNNTTDMINRETTIAPYSPFRVVVWGGVNDVTEGDTAVNIETRLQILYNYFVSIHAEVWALTITPRDDNTSPMLTVRDTVNTWIKNTATNVAKVIDAFTIIRDPNNTAIRLAAYADPGNIVHLNDAGMAAIIAAFP